MNSFNGISQYNSFVNSLNNTSSQSLTGDPASSLKEGQVFEGSINSVDDKGRVVIGLSNGQTLSARLDTGISITQGQSLFFQVKSNDGSLIQIKPVSLELGTNPTLLKALDSANVMATEKTISMVNSLMQESMPIDSESLASMNRLVLNNPTINPETLVLMTKYDLPVTTENANMFEAYSSGSESLKSSVDQMVTDISAGITEVADKNVTDAVGLNTKLNEIFLSFSSSQSVLTSNSELSFQESQSVINANQAVLQGQNPIEVAVTSDSQILDNVLQDNQALDGSENYNSNLVVNVLSEKQINSLQNILTTFDGFTESNRRLFDDQNNFRLDLSVKDLFNDISTFLEENTSVSKTSVKDLFSGSAYKSLLNNLISNSYSIEPEEITKPGKINETFERVIRLTQNIAEVFKDSGSKASENLKNVASEVNHNVNFMNSANEIYNFIQIPLKMYNQNTEGTLYVKQNKKTAYENGEEISCYLHFDMENLGPTDIYIKLCKRNVDCSWHLASEESMNLIEANIGMLEERLEKLGFNCSMEVKCEEKKADFLNDFLRSDSGEGTSSLVHRYSFDMKA